MIGVKLNGRLGNQMFQYAFAFATAKKLKTNYFLIENELNAEELSEYFELPNYRRSVASRFRFKYFHWMKYNRRLVKMYHNGPIPLDRTRKFENNCIYEGFFQSSFYFEHYKNQIKKEFSINEKHCVNVHEFLNIEPKQKIIAIHVRRTDYSMYGDEILGGRNLQLPVKYYNAALQQIGSLENYIIVFVTDDPSFVTQNFSHFNSIVSSSKSPIVDFQILMSADVVIVANSSFSWWGAYLNKNATQIFAPRYWSGFKIKQEYPPDIIPSNWKTIEVQ